MRAIIVAAGLGTRMGLTARSTPKCLLKVGHSTILDIQAKLLRRAGISDITVVIGKQGSCWQDPQVLDQIRRIVPQVVINEENDTTNNTFSLLSALSPSEGDTLVLDGDLLLTEDCLKTMITAYPGRTVVMSRLATSKEEPGNRLLSKEGRVLEVSRVLQTDFPYSLYGGVLRIAAADLAEFYKELARPENKPIDLGVPLDILCKKIVIYEVPCDGGWVNANTPNDLVMAQKLLGL